MSVAYLAKGAQKLKIVRTDEGQVSGYLQCSVCLDFGAQEHLVLEETLLDVPIGYVLNPQNGVFLADEVQRAMRLGIAHWLSQVMTLERVSARKSIQEQGPRQVSFCLPIHDGSDCELHVEVDTNTPADRVDQAALEWVKGWIAQQQRQRQPLDAELLEVIGQIKLVDAPHLRCGLALMNPSASFT